MSLNAIDICERKKGREGGKKEGNEEKKKKGTEVERKIETKEGKNLRKLIFSHYHSS